MVGGLVVFGCSLGKLPGLEFLFGHFHLAVEAQRIAVGEEKPARVVAVPVVGQYGRNLVVCKTFGIDLWVYQIVVVGDAPVLGSFLMQVADNGVHLILVAQIGSIECGIEVSVVLILEVASCIEIIKVESYAQALAEVGGEACIDMVFAACLVAAVVVSKVGDGRKSVCEVPVVGFAHNLRIDVGKAEASLQVSVGKDACQSWRVVRPRGRKFSRRARSKGRVGEEVRQRVGLCPADIAETAVDGPHMHAPWYLFLLVGCVLVVGIEVSPAALSDIAVGCHLVEHLCLHVACGEKCSKCSNEACCLHLYLQDAEQELNKLEYRSHDENPFCQFVVPVIIACQSGDGSNHEYHVEPESEYARAA